MKKTRSTSDRSSGETSESSRSQRPGITDAGVDKLRARIGIPEPHPQPPHYERPDEDAFRHVANAYGDDNPLWCDPDYAKGTLWGGPIAPPLLVGAGASLHREWRRAGCNQSGASR